MARSAEAKARQTAKDAARWAAVAAEFALYTESQYRAADAQCRGHLLSAEGQATVTREIDLWTGPARRAYRLASEELRNFWDANGRMTVAEFQRQWTAEQRDAREAAREATDGDADLTNVGWGE